MDVLTENDKKALSQGCKKIGTARSTSGAKEDFSSKGRFSKKNLVGIFLSFLKKF